MKAKTTKKKSSVRKKLAKKITKKVSLKKKAKLSARRNSLRQSIDDIGRIWHRSQPTRMITYGSLSALALSLGFFFVLNHSKTPSATKEIAISTRAVENSRKSASTSENKNKLLLPQFTEVKSLDFQKKIAYWSQFLEKKQQHSEIVANLVSGLEVNDNAPIVPAQYNCTTYVETVVALAQSSQPQEFLRHLLSIRYKNGQPSFENRNHFPEADWIPNNEKSNNLVDITQRVANLAHVAVLTESKEIDRGKWLESQVASNEVERKLASAITKEWHQPIKAQVHYIPIAEIPKILPHIPEGTVLNLVHKDNPKYPVLITHQGFVIQQGNQVSLRHASLSGHIRTNELNSYIKHLANHEKRKAHWPLIGVNLNQINDSASARSRFNESM
jgi:hypothetical protein